MYFETNLILCGFMKTVFKTESIVFIYLVIFYFNFYAFAMVTACKSSLT